MVLVRWIQYLFLELIMSNRKADGLYKYVNDIIKP